MKKLVSLLLINIGFFFSSSALAAMSCTNLFNDGALTYDGVLETLGRSQKYLDERNKEWSEKQKCLCCHTTLPYVLARALDPESANQFNAFERVAREGTEKKTPEWYRSDRAGYSSRPTESVLNAITLIMFDRQQADPTLRPITLQAVNEILTYLDGSGRLHWLDFGLQPFESKESELWGNSMALLAIEMAKKYSDYQPVSEKYDLLKGMLLQKKDVLNLNEKSILIWAHSLNNEIMPAELLREFRSQIAIAQNEDGSFNQKSFLGQGKDLADIYSTSIGLIAMIKAGEKKIKLKKAARWLFNQQSENSLYGIKEPRHFFPSLSMNSNRNLNNLFASDTATAYAELALSIFTKSQFN